MTTDTLSADPGAAEQALACARAALPHWGLQAASLRFVSARENIVFRADAPDDAAYALRIHRPGYHSLAELRSENAWTTALSDAGIDTPRPVPSLQGEPYVASPWPGESPRMVGLVAWIEGVPMWDALRAGGIDHPALMADIGALIARMHNQASDWRLPEGFTRPLLDADGLIGRQPWWGSFWDLPEYTQAQARLIEAARSRMHRQLLGHARGIDRFSIIHSDVLPQNVLLRQGRPVVFDFDDSAFGWHMYDLAVALIGFIQQDDFPVLRRALLHGYRRERALPDDGQALLSLLLVARQLVQIGWMNHRVRESLRISATQTISREALLRPRIINTLQTCTRLLDGEQPFPIPED